MDERLCLPSRNVRRTPLEESLRTSQLSANELVDRLAVDGLARESSHDSLHDSAHVLGRCGPRLLNRIRDGLLDRSRLSRSGKVSFENVNLSLFFIRQLGSATLGELLD